MVFLFLFSLQYYKVELYVWPNEVTDLEYGLIQTCWPELNDLNDGTKEERNLADFTSK